MAHGSWVAGEVQIKTFFFQDGDCQNVSEELIANIEVMAMPGMGPESVFLFDFEGVQNNINIDGYITESTTTRASDNENVKTIEQQKNYLKNMVDGVQKLLSQLIIVQGLVL